MQFMYLCGFEKKYFGDPKGRAEVDVAKVYILELSVPDGPPI